MYMYMYMCVCMCVLSTDIIHVDPWGHKSIHLCIRHNVIPAHHTNMSACTAPVINFQNFNELAEWPPKDSSFRASQKELTSFRAFAVQLLTRFNFNNMQGSDDKAADIDKKLSRAFQNMPIDASIIRFFYAVLRHVDQVAFKQNK